MMMAMTTANEEPFNGGDSGVTDEQRPFVYPAWTRHRDYWESLGECAEITDFRSGFQAGWAGRGEYDNGK